MHTPPQPCGLSEQAAPLAQQACNAQHFHDLTIEPLSTVLCLLCSSSASTSAGLSQRSRRMKQWPQPIIYKTLRGVMEWRTCSLPACMRRQRRPWMQTQQQCARSWPICSQRLPPAAAAGGRPWPHRAWGMQACAGLWLCAPSTGAAARAAGPNQACLHAQDRQLGSHGT